MKQEAVIDIDNSLFTAAPNRIRPHVGAQIQGLVYLPPPPQLLPTTTIYPNVKEVNGPQAFLEYSIFGWPAVELEKGSWCVNQVIEGEM